MSDAELEKDRLGGLAAVVPAWRPDEQMVLLVRALVGFGFGAVVVVDDGSGAGFAEVFAAVEGLAGVRVLRHAENRGKGRALKTGIAYVLAELPKMAGVVTADADGQHRAEDVARVGMELMSGLCSWPQGLKPHRIRAYDGRAEALPYLSEATQRDAGAVVLGVRTRLGEGPWRSRVGNAVTRRVFAWRTGVRLVDTQTGLRGFPRALLAELAALPGERYEYEMAVLAAVCRRGRPVEVGIETVYEAGNKGSHFAPVQDSLRVMWVLLRQGL